MSPSHPARRLRRAALVLALPAALGLAACGEDDKKSSEESSSKPTTVTAKVTEQGKKASISLPKSVKAGAVTIRLQNSGKQPHDLQVIRVTGGKTAQDVVKTINSQNAKIPAWIAGGGGVGTTPPGQTRSATQVLTPGTYHAIDTEGSEGGNATATFKVTGSPGSAKLPTTTGTVRAREYGFDATGLKAGKAKITYENVGKELHHLIAAPVRSGATNAQVKKYLETEGETKGPPPVDFEKGGQFTSVIDGGEKQVVDLNLRKGKYVMVCFIADRKGGPPHIAKGMLSYTNVQ